MYISPLNIVLVWDSSIPEKEKYSDYLKNRYCTSGSNEYSNMDIFVDRFYFGDKSVEIEAFMNQYTLGVETVLIVVMISDHSKIEFGKFIVKLYERKNSNNIYLLPIGLCESAYKIHPSIENKNWNIPDLSKQYSEQEEEFLFELEYLISYQSCKILNNLENDNRSKNDKPVHLFISYSRNDNNDVDPKGDLLAAELQSYISHKPGISSFYDIKDIEPGEKFDELINENLVKEETSLLIILTDSYSSRPWCIQEGITAKQNIKPIVCWICLHRGESRSLTYMGNIPTIINQDFASTEKRQFVFLQVVCELLRNTLQRRYFKAAFKMIENADQSNYILPCAPELITINYLIKQKIINKGTKIIYPNPALSSEELNILNEVFESMQLEYLSEDKVNLN